MESVSQASSVALVLIHAQMAVMKKDVASKFINNSMHMLSYWVELNL